jgi:hypothetical protein
MKVKTQSAKLKVGCAVRGSHKGKSKSKGQRAKGKSEKPYVQKSLPRENKKSRYGNAGRDPSRGSG